MAADEQLSAELAGKRSEPLLGCCRMSIACRCLEMGMLQKFAVQGCWQAGYWWVCGFPLLAVEHSPMGT